MVMIGNIPARSVRTLEEQFQIIYNQHLQKSVKKATLAALVSSSGAILAMTVAVVQQVQWIYDQTNFFPVDYYFAYFGFGISLNLSIHPWCLMAIFPDVGISLVKSNKILDSQEDVHAKGRQETIILKFCKPFSLSENLNSNLPFPKKKN